VKRVAVIGFALAVVLGGCGSAGATDEEVEQAEARAYAEGERSGEVKAAAMAEGRTDEAKRAGFRDGLRSGAEQAIPEDVREGERYMVTYRHGPMLGWQIDTWLGMPLGTTWRCDDFESCNELPATVGAYEPEPSFEEESYEDEYEPSYEYGAPTTEDFGEGNGEVVQCADGTWSDSGGVQGACSQHGGEG
jgi:hypothetical protein